MLRIRPALAVAAALVGAGALAGCGGGEARVALAIESARRPHGTVVLTVECATHVSVRHRPDPAGSGLDQVTVWGRPQVGRCHPRVQVPGIDRDELVDGATSQVVHVAPAAATN